MEVLALRNKKLTLRQFYVATATRARTVTLHLQARVERWYLGVVRRVGLVLLGLLVAQVAAATPFVPRDQLVEEMHPPARLARSTRPLATPAGAMAQLALLVEFEKKMQFATACDGDAGTSTVCNFGGQIEVESGPANMIIESDNTQEAIWDWSYYRRLTGQMGYAPQISNAFDYLSRFPGWNEWMDGGDPGPDYYSFYNCGWGVRAILEYEAATGDTSHRGYGQMCADHITQYAPGQAIAGLIDAAAQGWAASGLWLWADARGDAAGKQTASTIGAHVKTWLDAFASRPAATTWAVSGGAAFYGVVNSYLKDHPGELDGWVAQTAPHLGGWIDESMPTTGSWTDWRNAHNAWNMLAHFAAARVLSGADADAHRQVALDIYDRLVAQDMADMDGGIPGSQQRPPTEDQSWITSYLAYFGIQEVIALGTPPPPDAGVDAPAPDASGGSGGSGGSGAQDMSGCSCSFGPTRAASGALVLGALALMALGARRRRR